jgi:hypothetical protein
LWPEAGRVKTVLRSGGHARHGARIEEARGGVTSCIVQRLQPCCVRHGNIGAAFDQQAQHALMAGAGGEHERGDGDGGGGVEVESQVREQFDHVHAAKRRRNMNGKGSVVGRSGSESRTVHADSDVIQKIEGKPVICGKRSHVEKLGDVLEVALGRQVHGVKASSNSGRDISAGFCEEDHHFVNAAQSRDANGRGAVGEDMVGIGLRLLQQILCRVRVPVPNGQFEPGQL